MTTAFVIVAAGSGTRLGQATPKAFITLGKSNMLEHCVEAVASWDATCTVIAVVPENWVEPARELLASYPGQVIVVAGGASRTESVRVGLGQVPDGTDFVLIHDAARALMPADVFERVRQGLQSGAVGVVPTLPVVDTLVVVDHDTADTSEGVDRSVLGVVQTPQGFHASVLASSYQQATGDFTDDASVVRQAGHRVISVPGDPRGFKITYDADLQRARDLLFGGQGVRVGVAIDVHQFDDSAKLWLAGLEWPGERGLSGHSDGDVALHAIVDALFQAAGLGDLGSHFGSDRPEFAGARSTVFLEHALSLLQQAGYEAKSVGVQIVANHPKIGTRRLEAEEHLSQLVGAPVALSATTTDGLGLTGRGEGAAAIATAVISPLF